MTRDELTDLVRKTIAEKTAAWDAEDAAKRAQEEAEKAAAAKAWHDNIAPVAIACGVRPLFVPYVVEQARAVFELANGALRPKPGILHPRDPCVDLDVLTWMADLRASEQGDFLFEPIGTMP
jgi:hypothetical protein